MLELFLMAGALAAALCALCKAAELLGCTARGVALRFRRAQVAWHLFYRPSRVQWEDINGLPTMVMKLARGDRLWPRWWCATVGIGAAVTSEAPRRVA